ncbi:uncharacterized protein TRAVEDRAFT_23779 [Trametes versicolor FP-101664 SS1]|uniref:uncharacterized protein n=1 Tax=Trametes versicolor (strain FP-101664) TaxID=717944 RepID=UPI00046214F2|nr:uncharacterized protein TRAVEDRAFT_23779 [Trametes versicolor FP-101664 SS1]EIW53408.1 hypothetical protein TRAVEDRAFT_23779 [Trametes versicolor FP-101664 SS1]
MPRRVSGQHLDIMFQFKAIKRSYLSSGLAQGVIGGLANFAPLLNDLEYVFQTLSAPRHRSAAAVQDSRIVAPAMAAPSSHPDPDPEAHLQVPGDELKYEIVAEWQRAMSLEAVQDKVCAVCGRDTPPKSIALVNADSIDFSLLCNPELPVHVLPTTYNRAAYHGAILHPKGMTTLHEKGDVHICKACLPELQGGCAQMPKFALANWLYYGHDRVPANVKAAFSGATYSERLLVSRARASKISYKFSKLPGHYLEGSRDMISQGCIKGNVAIHPQDATHLNDVLPPASEVIRDMVCAVFVGEKKPTAETLESLKPVLVRKSRLKSMISFLLENNPWYAREDGFQGFSQRNMDDLFGPGTADVEQGVPCSMQIGHIQLNNAVAGATAGYVPGADDQSLLEDDGTLMEAVGYTESDDALMDFHGLTLKAIAHCMKGGGFIQSQAGSRFVPDFQNPRLLSWLFPHLDPWGIGGFFEPRRRIALTLDQQLSYMLSVHGSPFRHDPDFAFVYYNIRQKRAVFDSIAFRVPASQRDYVTAQMMNVDVPTVEKLIKNFKINPRYQPATEEETAIVRLLTKVNTVSHDLPGSNGYKVMLRNQIRALINYEGTPTLFVTLNPSDRDHPLVRLYAGDEVVVDDVMRGEEYSYWQRMVIAAENPSACARFFDQMMNQFIKVVLRAGTKKSGLFGIA